MRVSIIGLGKLGAPMAAVFAAKGHDVIGLDRSDGVLSALATGQAPVAEPGLQQMLDAGRPRLKVTRDHDALVADSDVTFIVVPTPSDANGVFSNANVVTAVASLGNALQHKDGYHAVTVTSTVMPGSMDHVVAPALERASGRRLSSNLGLCYNPEFIALGNAIKDMLEPDFLLIGESDERAGSMVASVYEPVCAKHPPIKRMNFINAELAKIAVNTFVTTKISYANMLADLCDRLPGADVDVVTDAVGLDSRIGRKYLRGAIGYGGPCFPRDNVAFAALARQMGASADIAEATDAINRRQIKRIVAAVTARLGPGRRVAILGMSYKPDTTIIEESQGVMLAQRLQQLGYAVVIHDPVATTSAAAILGPAAEQALSVQQALAGADLAVISTPWPEYARLNELPLQKRIPVVDCWRLLQPKAGGTVEVIWLGQGHRFAVGSPS